MTSLFKIVKENYFMLMHINAMTLLVSLPSFGFGSSDASWKCRNRRKTRYYYDLPRSTGTDDVFWASAALILFGAHIRCTFANNYVACCRAWTTLTNIIFGMIKSTKCFINTRSSLLSIFENTIHFRIRLA